MSKYAQTFMKKMVDEDVLNDKYLLKWYDKETRLDKDSVLYDKKAEKKFRDLIEKFIEWLRNAESESGDSSSESDDPKAKKEAKKEESEDENLEESKTKTAEISAAQ